MKHPKQPLHIKADAVSEIAKQGVARALAARQAALELTAEQTAEVSGGVVSAPTTSAPSLIDLLKGGRIYGGIFGDLGTTIFGTTVGQR